MITFSYIRVIINTQYNYAKVIKLRKILNNYIIKLK
jgi:hypothetical protein